MEETFLKTINDLSFLLSQPSQQLNHSQIQIFTSKISKIVEALPSEEDFIQSAVNLIYIQSFYNISEREMMKVSKFRDS